MIRKILNNFNKSKVLAIVSHGGTRNMAANYVGCHPRTIFNESVADPKFASDLRHAEVTTEYLMLKSVTDAGRQGTVHAAKWVLERLYPDSYRPRKPDTFPYLAVKQFVESLIARLADQAPSEEERRRILETGSALAQELLGIVDLLEEEITEDALEADETAEDAGDEPDPAANAETRSAESSAEPPVDRCMPLKPDEAG